MDGNEKGEEGEYNNNNYCYYYYHCYYHYYYNYNYFKDILSLIIKMQLALTARQQKFTICFVL